MSKYTDLTILEERKNPIMVLSFLIAGTSLPPLLRHLDLTAVRLKVVPELINSWLDGCKNTNYLDVHMDLT